MSQEQMDRMVDSLHQCTAEEVAARIIAESSRHNHQQRQHEIVNVEFEAMCDRIEKQCDC